MPLLLYCVAAESAADTDVRGVDQAPVQSVVHGGLRFFFSQVSDDSSSRDIVTAAQQVHKVVSDIFTRTAVLPFRYSTVVANEAELAKLAADRSAAFQQYLQRVDGKVQMDVRLTLEENPGISQTQAYPGHPGSGATGVQNSGRAYLLTRARSQELLSAAAETCRQAALSAEWKIQSRNENIRCQALISRVEVVSFFTRMRTLDLPVGVKAAVSGPWPPAGFWEDELR